VPPDDGRMTETSCGSNIGRGEEDSLLSSCRFDKKNAVHGTALNIGQQTYEKVNEELFLDKTLHVVFNKSKLAYRIYVILVANKEFKKEKVHTSATPPLIKQPPPESNTGLLEGYRCMKAATSESDSSGSNSSEMEFEILNKLRIPAASLPPPSLSEDSTLRARIALTAI
jgi:hypothetical protein